MGTIVPFNRPATSAQPSPDEAPPAQPGEDDGPHLSGDARCNGCGHEWVAVAPIGSADSPFGELACPACNALKGVLVRHCIYEREGFQHWHCLSCRGLLFSIVLRTDGEPMICCANCGSVGELVEAWNHK
jgi:hypothetical protein